ncbi:DUF2291 domain-containing protein [Marivivens donghaensis]|uniref:DUF2291 domain-containing protein n=1 Tax=Marivivens donghaensis TaxID=1699413 RepID=A0ABX0VTN3_9RHOB|nr:DUF2291 domain-containing protein [Marivivens donghaensis]NIY71231.1 DUF2291 domain-containing protein [Marivivens donghaensis]
MRDLFTPLAILSCMALPLAGCKIVKNPDPNDASVQAAEMTDEARMAAYADEIWTDKVLPTVSQNAVSLTDLHAQIDAEGLDAAGAAHGLRPEGEANPWNFAANGEGTIVEANTESRAAKLMVDVDADGAADLTLQLGPVIRGTALRDAMPFIVFTDFRDQIEFAKLARALNDLANAGLSVPEGDLVGRTVTFEGVYTLRNKSDAIELVPTTLQVQ